MQYFLIVCMYFFLYVYSANPINHFPYPCYLSLTFNDFEFSSFSLNEVKSHSAAR